MNLTEELQKKAQDALPYDQLLPAEQPVYVHSYVYLFGIGTVVSLVLLIVTGIVLAAFGPQWWHNDDIGHFFNSMHFWSVQAFFFFMIVHLWSSFFMGAWRDGRGLTWVAGVITFGASILTAFTGYISQQNFDSQWIALQGKDAINATGLGAFFDVLNFGQMYGWHVVILPLLVLGLTISHLILVRMRGIVKPYELNPGKSEPPASEGKVSV
ncbi:MAG: cytochrome b N-terminal domain-containing protein [Chloroflexota bacterium]